jgi:hypothetical protein
MIDPCCNPAAAAVVILEAEITGLQRQLEDLYRQWDDLQRQRDDLNRRLKILVQCAYEVSVYIAGKQVALAEFKGDHEGADKVRAVLARHCSARREFESDKQGSLQ